MMSGEALFQSPAFSPPRVFGVCGLCGKKLVSWDPNNMMVYIFGDNLHDGSPIVNIRVAGSVMLQCTRKSCRRTSPDHWNIFNCFE